MRRARSRIAGTLVCLGVAALAIQRVEAAPVELTRPLRGDEREQVDLQLAEAEPGFRREAVREFPGDLWSQGDAFHSREDTQVREIVGSRNVALESVLDVLDASLRAHPDKYRPAGAPPCKPRPTYD